MCRRDNISFFKRNKRIEIIVKTVERMNEDRRKNIFENFFYLEHTTRQSYQNPQKGSEKHFLMLQLFHATPSLPN